MKKAIKWAVYFFAAFCAFCILVAVFDDSDTKTNETNVESKVESKAESKKKNVVERKEDVVENKEDSFLGVYEVTDKVGCTIRITINDDETATVTGVRGEDITYYCSWQDFISSGGGIMLKFSDEMPLLIFEGGQDKDNGIFKRFFLKDGWLYSEYENAKSKNPKWRLKANKIK